MGAPQAEVTIITRTRERPVALERAVKDVLCQSFRDWHLIVVNDGGERSPVGHVIESHAAALNGRATLLHLPENRGMEAAANLGAARSVSRYLAIHDDDDTWHPEFLAKTVARLRASPPSVGGVVTSADRIIERMEAGSLVELRREVLFLQAGPVSAHALLRRNLFPPISLLFARSAFETVGAFREDLPALGDWEFNIRLASRFEIVAISEVLAHWHVRHGRRSLLGGYANSPYRDHLAALIKLRREWGQSRPFWRYLMLWRY